MTKQEKLVLRRLSSAFDAADKAFKKSIQPMTKKLDPVGFSFGDLMYKLGKEKKQMATRTVSNGTRTMLQNVCDMTVSQAVVKSGLSETTIRSLIRANQIRFFKDGSNPVKVSSKDVCKYAKERKVMMRDETSKLKIFGIEHIDLKKKLYTILRNVPVSSFVILDDKNKTLACRMDNHTTPDLKENVRLTRLHPTRDSILASPYIKCWVVDADLLVK